MDAGALLDLLGNENRRRILKLIARKPCYVTEISEHLGVSPKAVIDHLRKLEEAGLIESQVDEQRRKYFHIAQNLRLEVTLAPYSFGMKSAYPASPSLDISSWEHLSLEVSRTSVDGHGAVQSDAAADDLTALVAALEEFEELERELSLAQRWVQGRIAEVLDDLADTVDDEHYLDAEIIAAVAGGARDPVGIGREVDVPPGLVEERLRRLERRGVVEEVDDEWALADSQGSSQPRG